LVIKRYPYEQEADNDEEFTHAYEQYKSTLPSDLEKHFGTPDFVVADYSAAGTENLEKDKNCEKKAPKEGEKKSQTCYTCRNPKTGGSYEQCSYEEAPEGKKYFYGGSTSSSSTEEKKPVKYRYRRDLDFFQPSGYEYFVYNDDPALKRKARAEEKVIKPKRKTKKYSSKLKKIKNKRPPRQQLDDPSSNIEGPPESYEGPRYTYEGPISPYEGPSDPYEGPRSSYEGPSSPYEGPDHDGYYDRTGDRIPYKSNEPLTSSFFSESRQKPTKRPRRGPKSEIEEFNPSDSGYFSDYRFGPEFFDEEAAEEKPEPIKRNTNTNTKSNVESVPTNTDFFPGNVKIFKNGDVCEKTKKKDMICMVCNNDKTGAKYEQCQFSTNPNKKQYSYGSQKSFSSIKPEKERRQRQVRFDEPGKIAKKVTITKVEQKQLFNEGNEPLITEESRVSIRRQRETENEENVEGDDKENAEELEENEDDEKNNEESEKIEARDGIEGLDVFLADDKNEDTYPKESESYEDYFKRIFPEFEVYGKLTPENFDPFSDLEEFRKSDPTDKAELITYEPSESVASPTRLKDEPGLPRQFFESDEESKKNLRNAFESFKNRDWSKCKKMQKDKLVCFTCLDKDGIKNEECMYVEGTEPVSSHLAYHEKKDYDPAASNIHAQTNFTSTEAPPLIDRADNNTEVLSETKKLPMKLKGDFEGVPKVPKSVEVTTSASIRKRKFPIKKYGDSIEAQGKESAWESSKQNKKDDGVVKIFFNNTDSALKA